MESVRVIRARYAGTNGPAARKVRGSPTGRAKARRVLHFACPSPATEDGWGGRARKSWMDSCVKVIKTSFVKEAARPAWSSWTIRSVCTRRVNTNALPFRLDTRVRVETDSFLAKKIHAAATSTAHLRFVKRCV